MGQHPTFLAQAVLLKKVIPQLPEHHHNWSHTLMTNCTFQISEIKTVMYKWMQSVYVEQQTNSDTKEL